MTLTANKNPLSALAPKAPSSGIWNPDDWRNPDVSSQFDAGRHYGGIGLAGLMGNFQDQIGQVGAGIANQNFARSGLNELASPQGRQKMVSQFGNAADRRAYELGKKMRGMQMERGQDYGDAAELSALNNAAIQTGEYAQDLESPENLAKIYASVYQANSPDEILSILDPMGKLDAQDYPRYIAWLQESARKGGMGGLLGALGQIAGLATGGGNPLSLLGGILKGGGGGGGGSDASSGLGDLAQVTG